MACADCELLAGFGFGDRICFACAAEILRVARLTGAAMGKVLDQIVIDVIEGNDEASSRF